ncbi:MAG: serine/threonine protein kinase [Verrucomicrobia bacterium]|nr:serine/threonine protein kinase [Verrucomicrobiota bacterium]
MSKTFPSEEALFADALAQPPAERGAFLAQACHGNDALRAHLAGLLAANDVPGSLLESPITVRSAPLPDLSAIGLATAEENPGDLIGRYKLLEKLGVGGCGVVWMAEQAEPVRRRVALKVIKAGMDTREVITRFEAERQALAMMDHPGIAKVLDAGATGAGRPYFVMDLVRGVPITKYSDEQNLGIRARLELFIRVCEAVQHAHQKGIIHRDLKPSNILVSLHESVPLPTVIDFGIAKAIQGRLTDATLFTSYDQIIGTPAYMSPEQADTRGLDIDTRSDVYSLGVVLYELLAGRCPFDPGSLDSPNRDEIRRLIREVEPPRPSTRFSTLTGADRATVARRRGTDPARLPVLLAGDLDWIVMKALEKNRTRRYDTPTALAEDIARHLRNEPVAARPPGRLYRWGKFMRRNRLAVSMAATIALTLVAGTAISIAQMVRARGAERAASAAWSRVTDERARADDLLTFIFEDLKEPLARIGELGVLDRVIEKAIAYFASHDPRELDDRALVRHVTALNQLGGLRMDQARYPEAEQAYREAHVRAALIVVRTPGDAAALWARGQAEWGNGFVRYKRGQMPAAREWFARERATREALVALEPGDPRWQRELAKQAHNLAAIEMEHGDMELARASFRAELSALELLAAASPRDLELQNTMAIVTSFLGSCAEAAGDFAEAAQRFAEQTSRLESIGRAEPGNRHWRYKQADSLSSEAGVFAITGRRSEEARHLAQARELLSPLVEHDATNQRWRRALAVVNLRQAQLAQAEGDTTRGLQLARAVRREVETLAEKEPSDLWAQYRLPMVLRVEAELQHAAGAPEAGATAARAVDAGERLIGREGATNVHRAERAAAGVIAGRVAAAQGNRPAAEAHWQRAHSMLGPIDPKCRDWRILDPAARLARLLGRNEHAAAIISTLEEFGYVPLEPWPQPLTSVSASNTNAKLK